VTLCFTLDMLPTFEKNVSPSPSHSGSVTELPIQVNTKENVELESQDILSDFRIWLQMHLKDFHSKET